MSFQDDLQAAAKSALCGWLANGGNAMAATWIVNGAKTPATGIASAGAALGLLALNYACNYDSGVGGPSPIDGCKEASPGGWGYVKRRDSGGNTSLELGFAQVSSFGVSSPYQSGNFTVVDITAEVVGQGTKSYPGLVWGPGTTFFLDIQSGTCGGSGSPDDPVQLPPYQYTSPTTNCTYNVEFQAWSLNEDGTAQPVLKISKGASLFASGGIIGGCNFDPVIYIPPGGGGGGGGGYVAPWLPGPDGPNGEPWWWDVLKGAGGAVIGSLINRLINKLLEEKAPAVTYRVVSVCETDAQGEPISQSREVSIPQLPILDGLVARMDAMDDLMQGLKDFKQPICEPEPPAAPVGKNISIQFRSTAPSPFGENRLRKVFRYRDPSLKDLAEHRDHWKDFEWKSGPWMVISQGLLWGKPQVWAESEAEGKRVLRHAAQICGMNLDSPSHRWRVSQVVGLRERPVLKMKVHRDINGHYWVAERTGSAGLPLVAAEPSTNPGLGG